MVARAFTWLNELNHRVLTEVYSFALTVAAQGLSKRDRPGILAVAGRHPAVLVPISAGVTDHVLSRGARFAEAMARTDAEAAAGQLEEASDVLARLGVTEEITFRITKDVQAPLETVTAGYMLIVREPQTAEWLDKSAHADFDMHERSVVFRVAAPFGHRRRGLPDWASRTPDVRIVMHETKDGATEIIASGVRQVRPLRRGPGAHDVTGDLEDFLDRLKLRLESP